MCVVEYESPNQNFRDTAVADKTFYSLSEHFVNMEAFWF